MKFEITHKDGKKEILEKKELPKFSPYFNKMVKELNVDESMYEVSSMTNIKRIS